MDIKYLRRMTVSDIEAARVASLDKLRVAQDDNDIKLWHNLTREIWQLDDDLALRTAATTPTPTQET